MPKSHVAINGRGDVRLDFVRDGQGRTIIWEEVKDGILETMFDEQGAILLQRALTSSKRCIDYFSKFKAENSLREVETKPFEEVKLRRQCPNCASGELMRHVEAYRYSRGVPVMPMYRCSACRSDSYYLTDAYLDYMVSSNGSLFEEEELKLKQEDNNAFKKELKGNIISIFASKKIRRIL